jgi:hypothetical protein
MNDVFVCGLLIEVVRDIAQWRYEQRSLAHWFETKGQYLYKR